MRMSRQKVRDIHLAFSSSDRGLGSALGEGLIISVKGFS